jgi:ferrous iron transport protein A
LLQRSFDIEKDSQKGRVLAMTSRLTLARTELMTDVRVRALHGDEHELQWLRAVGLFEGQTVRVLRRAPFGGPMHIRVGSGGEFAVDPTLAAHIEVALVAA